MISAKKLKIVVFKAAWIGVALGFLLSVLAFSTLIFGNEIANVAFYLLLTPSAWLFQVFHINPSAHSGWIGSSFFVCVILPTLVNSFCFFIAGTILGFGLALLKSKAKSPCENENKK